MASTSLSSSKRVGIIGAGWAGLIAAKTYLEINPQVQLTIFESERTLGGVWNEDRCFPGFIADSPSGLFDFSDLPMSEAVNIKDWSDLESSKVYEYLVAYAEKFSLLDRIRLGTRISHVCRNADGKAWDLSIEDSEEIATFDKLIIAAGLNSQPYWPVIPRNDFQGKVIHSKDIGLQYQYLISKDVERVTVYGGCKSGVDAIILLVNAGKKVDWVIRDTGNGPGVMVELRPVAGIHGARLAGRWKNVLTPSIFATTGWWYRFLHSGKSRIGKWVFNTMWRSATTVPLGKEPYRSGGENMEKLRPEIEQALWFTAGLSGLHGNQTFIDALHTGDLIKVHRASITSMSGSNINLSNGECIQSDTAVFATGWDFNSKLFSAEDALTVGLPSPLSNEDANTADYWNKIHAQAEQEVINTLPALKDPPKHYQRQIEHTPYRLYRYMLPSSLAAANDRSLTFLGLVINAQTTIYSEVGALWCVSYLEGLLDIDRSKEEMDYDIAKINAWSERRYLARGKTRQVASAEIQDVTDVLMRDMGLKVYRKSNILSETFAPSRAQDYKGIVQEMLIKSRDRTAK